MDEYARRNPSRIILAIETRLLREMLERVIRRSPDHKLVCAVKDGSDLAELVERQDAQWVITSLSRQGDLPESAEHLLATLPRVFVMALAPDGSEIMVAWSEIHEEIIAQAEKEDSIVLRWSEPHQEALTDPSLPELLEVLRAGSGQDIEIGNGGSVGGISIGR